MFIVQVPFGPVGLEGGAFDLVAPFGPFGLVVGLVVLGPFDPFGLVVLVPFGLVGLVPFVLAGLVLADFGFAAVVVATEPHLQDRP